MLARTDLDQIEESAVAKIIRQRMIECEITANATANWYLVQTMPNEEGMALRWLARRGFGAFRPMQQRSEKRNPHIKIQGWEPVFPGWVFVFIWDIRRMKARIERCPGVFKVFSDPATKEPVVISDKFINNLRALGWNYEDNARPARVFSNYTKPPRKTRMQRPQKRHRKALQKLKKSLKRSGNWDSSTWEAMNDLAPHERITLLQRAVANSAALAG